MPRALPIAVLLPLLVLAGCDRVASDPGVDLTNASIAEVAEKAVAAQQQRPGQWEIATQLTNLEIEGLGDDSPVAEMMKQQLGSDRTQSQCLTEEDAKKAMVPQDLDPNGNCRFARFRMTGGQIDATLTCADPSGTGKMEVTQKGSYSPESYDLDSTITRSGGQGPGANSTMTMKVTGKRIGECKA